MSFSISKFDSNEKLLNIKIETFVKNNAKM